MTLSRRLIATASIAIVAAAVGFGVAGALAPTPKSPNALLELGQRPPSGRTLASVSSGTVESTYVPVANCRVVNTSAAGGKIANGVTRNFLVSGTTGFTAQGGTSTGCGIPTWATAVSARITSFASTATGVFYAFATGKPSGLGTLYYSKGVNIATGATVPLGTGGRISVKNTGGPAYTAIDVNGYYAQQISASLNGSGGVYESNSDRVLSNTRTGTGSYRVAIAGSLTGCTPIASIDGSAFIASAYTSGSYVYANTYTVSGTLTDLYWTLHVMC